MALGQSHLLNDVGALVCRKALQYFGHALGFELFKNGSATAHRWLIAEFGGRVE
jgi:hypothetical protein